MLDEAIAKAKEAENWQLAEWLRMARGSLSAARWYSKKLDEAHRTERKLLQENAKLRELVRSFHSGMLFMLETGMWATDPKWLEQRMRELGVEVDG